MPFGKSDIFDNVSVSPRHILDEPVSSIALCRERWLFENAFLKLTLAFLQTMEDAEEAGEVSPAYRETMTDDFLAKMSEVNEALKALSEKTEHVLAGQSTN